MPNYNSALQSNNSDLQTILQTVNALPTAGSGGGGFSIPTIDLREMGFPEINEENVDNYAELIFPDSETIDLFKTKIENGLVKLILTILGKTKVFTCNCTYLMPDSSDVSSVAEYTGMNTLVKFDVVRNDYVGNMLQLRVILT